MRTELPKKWYFKLRKENAQDVCDYVISNKPSYTNWIPSNILPNPYITNDGTPLRSTLHKYGKEITWDEFEYFVLGRSQQDINTNYEIY
jgi:hypothetical protein